MSSLCAWRASRCCALGEQQERLIEALLTLASSERGIERWEPFDLAEIAGQVILDRHQEAERRGLRIEADLGAAPATGDPSLAESLLVNLVDNAIRHNLDAGWVSVSTTIADGRAVVSVRNTGPGSMPPRSSGSSSRSSAWAPTGSAMPAGTGSAWPSSARSSACTAARSPPAPGRTADSTSR